MVETDGWSWIWGKYQNGSRDINRHVAEEDKQNCQNDSLGKIVKCDIRGMNEMDSPLLMTFSKTRNTT